MPGLSQLQRLNEDMLNLGDEVAIRSARSEKPVTVPIPPTIEDIDDSEDFRLGLPMLSEEEQAQADAAAQEAERAANDFSDFIGDEKEEAEAKEQEPQAASGPAAPDMSDLMAPMGDLDFSDLDLSDFADPEVPEEPEEPEEIPLEDLDLDALLAPKAPPAPSPAPKKEPPAPARKPAAKTPSKSAAEDETDALIASLLGDSQPKKKESVSASPDPALQALLADDEPLADEPEELELEALPELDDIDAASDMPEIPSGDDVIPALDEPEAALAEEAAPAAKAEEPLPEADSFSDMGGDFGEFSDTDNSLDLNMDLPEEFNEEPTQAETLSAKKALNISDEEEKAAEPAEIPQETAAETEVPDFQMPDEDFDMSSLPESTAEEVPDVSEVSSDFSTEGLDDLGNMDFSADAPADGGTSDFSTEGLDDLGNTDFSMEGTDSEPASDFSTEGLDAGAGTDFSTEGLDDIDNLASQAEAPAEEESTVPPEVGDTMGQGFDSITVSDYEGNIPDRPIAADEAVPDEEEPVETFDTSGMDDVDFSSDAGSDFELGNITDTESDDDIFNIPGFSDTVTANLDKKPEPAAVSEEGGKTVKNSFTDSEYERFKKNLAMYPLNVRIALEDLVVKNEFTDDAVFSILEKVLRKVPARTLAAELEKMMDISLPVPRDFERRSAEEYELYKQSLEYQLKNRIIPGAILSAAAAVMIFCVVEIFTNLIYRPLHARSLYKQGYALLEDNQYPQSEELFNMALAYGPKKYWFYRYAEGYREHRQYERSRMMYRAILQRFDHDKKAGLDWVDMEANDLYNYQEAERIMKREVLDYHINDRDAILKLGDVYLDWGTESDSSKLDEAIEQYSLYEAIHGASNDSQARKMLFFIRKDNLPEVLKYKELFFPKKKALGSRELTELSGYLLDKRFGTLRPAEESFRSKIEDLRELLERAVKADETNPVALYNMGRYFVQTNADDSAMNVLQYALSAFEAQKIRNKRDTYKYLDTYRLLGEEYKMSREYLKAESMFGQGIEMFEKQNAGSGFESDENVGRMYADLADIDYFISLDNETALKNYVNAVENKYDTPYVRYKIGYIHYNNENYSQALGSFIKSHETAGNDTHLLLALADTLVQNKDFYVAKGYYERLISLLNTERVQNLELFPQMRRDHYDVVDSYMKATNNLGVVLSRIAQKTGDSRMNASAIVNLQESLRAWDALSRNQTTMIRMEGSNLAEQNIKYLTNPASEYESEIYNEIPRTLFDETPLE